VKKAEKRVPMATGALPLQLVMMEALAVVAS
jgi:hypothetical protein